MTLRPAGGVKPEAPATLEAFKEAIEKLGSFDTPGSLKDQGAAGDRG